jgi:hypothetical protein
VLVSLIVLDLLLVCLHMLWRWPVIDLDQEGNLSAWYSSAKLLGLALLSVLIWLDEKKLAGSHLRAKWLWLVVGMIFLLLSADETASMHERSARFIMKETTVGLDIRETLMSGDSIKDSFAWVFLLSPFILGVVVFFLVFFYNRLKKCLSSLIPAMIALAMFLLAVLLEAAICFMPGFEAWEAGEVAIYRMSISIEETAEILGATLFLFAFYRYRESLTNSC